MTDTLPKSKPKILFLSFDEDNNEITKMLSVKIENADDDDYE